LNINNCCINVVITTSLVITFLKDQLLKKKNTLMIKLLSFDQLRHHLTPTHYMCVGKCSPPLCAAILLLLG